jgi:hypothetical protein
MVDRSRTYKTDDGEYMVRVVPGASDEQGPNWISSIHGVDSTVHDGLVGSFDTAQAALDAALTKIKYVDRSTEPPITSLTALYNDGRGLVRITVRSQAGKHRATVTWQGQRLMLGNVYDDAVEAFDEAMNYVLTDQSPVRSFAVNDGDQNPPQLDRIRINRGGDNPSCSFTIIDGDGGELYTSDTVYRDTRAAVIAATHWLVRNA